MGRAGQKIIPLLLQEGLGHLQIGIIVDVEPVARYVHDPEIDSVGDQTGEQIGQCRRFE